MRFDLGKVEFVPLVAADAVLPNETGRAIASGFLDSRNSEFHRLVIEFWGLYLSKHVPPEALSDFLVIIHDDLNAEVHLGPTVELKIRAKRNIVASERLTRRDMIDLIDGRFVDIQVLPTDCFVYCHRKDWTFGLLFDFEHAHNGPSRSESDLAKALGAVHRHVLFIEDYSLASSPVGQSMFDEGWFPFFELLGGDYLALGLNYTVPDRRDEFVDSFMNRFDKARLSTITERWWSLELLAAKRELLSAGVNAFLDANKSGYINSIKTMYSEIEGILRIKYFQETQRKPTFNDLQDFVADKARSRFAEESLAFPSEFYRYVREVLFKGFDLGSTEIRVSRHSSSHGVASAETYTRARALQGILAIDQLTYYLR